LNGEDSRPRPSSNPGGQATGKVIQTSPAVRRPGDFQESVAPPRGFGQAASRRRDAAELRADAPPPRLRGMIDE